MKAFDIPSFYKSSIIGKVKNARKANDPRKKDFTPTELDFGPISFLIPRHFGFCYGVENAIEISYRAIEENPGKRIFLLSQMIHNPEVNADLVSRGIQFIMDTEGTQFIPWEELNKDDVVIIPAFGTTVEIQKLLEDKGIETASYNTTCPFVEKVWKRSSKLGTEDFTVVIHGKHKHEETRATFSHSYQGAPSLVIKDIEEAKFLSEVILGKKSTQDFYSFFEGKYSEGFDAENDLEKLGVVNQTTMLATDTQDIANFLKDIMSEKYGADSYKSHFADTRDTLCYATNDNQQATYGVLEKEADIALVVGGYNSSNTSHIAELCERKLPTYFIKSESEILSLQKIQHYNYPEKKLEITDGWMPKGDKVKVILTSGASCPDAVVDRVMQSILSQFGEGIKDVDSVITEALSKLPA